MPKTQAVDLATLNALQPVLRGLTVSLATAARANLAELSSLLQAFAAAHTLDQVSRAMLLDLAEGLDTLAQGTRQ